MNYVVTYQLEATKGTQKWVSKKLAVIVKARRFSAYDGCNNEKAVGERFQELFEAPAGTQAAYPGVWPHVHSVAAAV